MRQPEERFLNLKLSLKTLLAIVVGVSLYLGGYNHGHKTGSANWNACPAITATYSMLPDSTFQGTEDEFLVITTEEIKRAIYPSIWGKNSNSITPSNGQHSIVVVANSIVHEAVANHLGKAPPNTTRSFQPY